MHSGTLNLSLAARVLVAVFAHVSTDCIFSGANPTPWIEDDLSSPVSVYGQTQAAREVAVLSHYSGGL